MVTAPLIQDPSFFRERVSEPGRCGVGGAEQVIALGCDVRNRDDFVILVQ